VWKAIGDDSVVIVARLVLVTTALAVCACYALGVLSTHDQSSVASLLDRHGSLTAVQASDAEAMLSDAKTLNPDPTLDVMRAEVEFRAGHVARAVRIAKDVAGRAPSDAGAWLVLELLTRNLDPATNRLAQDRVRLLVPPR
jgi:predicted Zn-dependent protease